MSVKAKSNPEETIKISVSKTEVKSILNRLGILTRSNMNVPMEKILKRNSFIAYELKKELKELFFGNDGYDPIKAYEEKATAIKETDTNVVKAKKAEKIAQELLKQIAETEKNAKKLKKTKKKTSKKSKK